MAALQAINDKSEKISKETGLLHTKRPESRSMSCRDNCWDNAVMERFFSNLKTELFTYLFTKSFVLIDSSNGLPTACGFLQKV
ncbi:MAG: hypothetical protein KDI92_13510 [Xanthomonadales bacterium]|nr:hypothetical protein [Xanthomonadales bacterium]